MSKDNPDITGMFAYLNAINDLSEAFEVSAKTCKQKFQSVDAQSMWWELYLDMHKRIREIKRKADDAFRIIEDDMYRQSMQTENEVPF